MGKGKTILAGCYGDGSLGHQHTRERCASIIDAYAEGFGIDTKRADISTVLAQLLDEEMSDDAGEEHEACDWLNDHVAVEGHSWGWQDGDFGLWPTDEEG